MSDQIRHNFRPFLLFGPAEARPWPTRAAARTAVFEWLEVWDNRQRRHSALAYQPPVTFEGGVLLSSGIAA